MPNTRLHSKYNPLKEAERFVELIVGQFEIIVITEPGESYLYEPLRKKFKNAKLIAIRYSDNDFLDSDRLWDTVWRPQKGSLSFFLINHIPEEYLAVTKFLPWKPANNVYPEPAQYVWTEIAKTIQTIKSIIYTRTVFGKRWFYNFVRNITTAQNIIHLQIPDTDFLLATAGPSLEEYLDYKIELPTLAVASALQSLTFHKIKPTFCISTDGGFAAKKHFEHMDSQIPVLAPLESALPYSVLKNNPIAILNYGSQLENKIFTENKIPSIRAKRNGTVSGTALELLLDNTNKNILISGLDLKASKGFSHSRPHASSQYYQNHSNRLLNLATYLAMSNFDIRSLETYAMWFLNLPTEKTKRIFRLGNTGYTMPNIKRIQMSEIPKYLNTETNKHYKLQNTEIQNSKETITEILHTTEKKLNDTEIKQILNTPSVEKEIIEFLAFSEFINVIKNGYNNESIQLLNKKIKTEINQLAKGLLR